jgi:hypothetical protein
MALGESDVSPANRILLGVRESAEQPPLNMLHCTKKLWIDYDLNSGNDRGALFAEVQKRRRPCAGFMRYRPGRSPLEHQGWEDHKRTRREKIIDRLIGAALGVAGTLLTAWLVKHYQLK